MKGLDMEQMVVEQPLEVAVAAAIAMMRRETIFIGAVYVIAELAGHQVTVSVEELDDATHLAVMGRETVAKRATLRALNSVRRARGIDGRIG